MQDFIKVIGWLVIIFGAVRLSISGPVLYMLLAGQVQPGDPYYLDSLAPTYTQAFVGVAIDLGLIFTSILVMYLTKRHALNKALKAQPSAAGTPQSGAP